MSAALTFTYYPRPTILAITPSGADASPTTDVTITGQGFTGLSTDVATRAAYLRCGFGIVAAAALYISDEQVVCPGLWRAPTADGTRTIKLTLNGLSHVERSVVLKPTPPSNPPILIDAFFGAAGLTTKVSFVRPRTCQSSAISRTQAHSRLAARTPLAACFRRAHQPRGHERPR